MTPEEQEAQAAAVVKSCQAATQREAYARREQTQAMRDYVAWLLRAPEETDASV
jgi:hypothetical protein